MSEPITPPRVAALETLRLVRRGELADRALERAAGGLGPRDHAWVQELAYGVFRLRGRIDFLLAALVRGGLESLEPDVLDVLRLGVYQLLEMGSVPPYAAVSQSVELARHAGVGRASGLVNGVLQSVRRKGSAIEFPSPERDPVGHLVHWGSHPRWLVERWIGQWGAREAAELVEANNLRPELFLRPLRHDPEQAVALLADAGIEAEAVALAPDSVRILPPHGARAALAALPAVVQDPAAALVARFAAVPADAAVLDVCAAPGGKALDLAAAARYVVAADLSFGRLRRVRENVDRVGLRERVGMVVADARQPPFRQADAVLLDAPCTGTGTLRRHSDGRWHLSPGQLGELVELQREILGAAAALVRPGGILVYSTCSLEPEENGEQVEWFLRENPGFRRDPAPETVDGSLLDAQGSLSVLPQRQGFDGSFAARLRRVA